MTRLRRMVVASFLLIATALVPMTIATAPAHADADDCVEYLADQGIDITPPMELACAIADHGDFQTCRQILRYEDVAPPIPHEACERAEH